MAISAAWSNASPVNNTRNTDTDVITSSRFMGATGPLLAPAAAMASAGNGFRRNAIPIKIVAKRCNRLRLVFILLVEDDDDDVLFLILFHSLLRIDEDSEDTLEFAASKPFLFLCRFGILILGTDHETMFKLLLLFILLCVSILQLSFLVIGGLFINDRDEPTHENRPAPGTINP